MNIDVKSARDDSTVDGLVDVHCSRRTAEYSVWNSMIQRVRGGSPKNRRNYMDRGITVCERWHKFENFMADMGPRPSPKHSIDRRDNDGNYEPGNCRWATRSEQSSNRRPYSSTGIKGVYRAANGGYKAILAGRHIGYFDTIADARSALEIVKNGGVVRRARRKRRRSVRQELLDILKKLVSSVRAHEFCDEAVADAAKDAESIIASLEASRMRMLNKAMRAEGIAVLAPAEGKDP